MINRIVSEVRKVVVGKDDVIRNVLMAMLAGGHVLLDDVPGVGKTTLASTLARAIGLDFGRIQFTPDVLPSDINGFTMYNRQRESFEYMPGILTQVNLLLCDEINRTSSKTQSALLEAMAERQVTVDGTTHPLKNPFTVIATQNNVGTAGTQLLPHAQLDRFMVRLTMGYPDLESQKSMIRDRFAADPLQSVSQVASRDDLLRMQSEMRHVEMVDAVIDYVARLAVATRESDLLELGISPRGAIVSSDMARAHAYIEGRTYTIPEDVIAILPDVCAHRIIISQKARAQGLSSRDVLAHILANVRVPDTIR